jgi:hypothetical protein
MPINTRSNQLTATPESELGRDCFLVVHPLDDYPEEKLKSDHLAPLEMTPAVRLSLFALRAYLMLMILLCFYHVIDLATHILAK